MPFNFKHNTRVSTLPSYKKPKVGSTINAPGGDFEVIKVSDGKYQQYQGKTKFGSIRTFYESSVCRDEQGRFASC